MLHVVSLKIKKKMLINWPFYNWKHGVVNQSIDWLDMHLSD